jgi:hypothetical protein
MGKTVQGLVMGPITTALKECTKATVKTRYFILEHVCASYNEHYHVLKIVTF